MIITTLCILAIYSIWFDTMSLKWFIVHTNGSHARNFKLKCTSVPEDCFIFASGAAADEMLHFVEFHLGLYSLSKSLLSGFYLTKIFLVSIIHYRWKMPISNGYSAFTL